MSLTHRVFYVSKASNPYDDATVKAVLQSSRRNNAKLDVTGCLLFSGCYFAQVLEGRTEVVKELVKRIAADSRHGAVKVLRADERTHRQYASWSMGYLHDLSLEDAIQHLLESEFTTNEGVSTVIDRMRPDSVMGALG